MAGLAFFGATLTLPGIAGIILTIGMAVDANVLIFERIREELRLGKSPRASIEGGYSKALVTILDANFTTLIVALVLFQFGTGPVRGFAVTLSLGILASLFTAIFVTRIVFDYLYVQRRIQKLWI
jgi:preprotein translocase subunit SecD